MLAILLGAGFSAVAGVPLASQLFDEEPLVDRIVRQDLVRRARGSWLKWHRDTGGVPEQYLSSLDQSSPEWHHAVWYVALVIALRMGRLRLVGGRPAITRHSLRVTTGNHIHEAFWTAVFRRTNDVAVLTSNFDILAERGLRLQARPRVPRPGFQYDTGPAVLAGRGYPSFAHLELPRASGSVPLLKLHGSVSWALDRSGILVRYHDCRPAIRGDAAIIAPVEQKSIPSHLQQVWDLAAEFLRTARTWIVVGYSLPTYDVAVRDLLRHAYSPATIMHIFDPDPGILDNYRSILPTDGLRHHQGLPEGLVELDQVLASLVAET